MKNKRGMLAIFKKKNNRGWIEIVEAFVAVLLIAGVVLIVLNKGYLQKTDISEQVYDAQLSILREVETNDTMRTEILSASLPLPIGWEDPRFPADIKSRIIVRTPNYLECSGKICSMNETCSLAETKDKDIYSQAVVISSTLQSLGYRQLNLFCWTK
jgi:hypothetical protein